jgi:hypothetical protein
MEILTYTLGSEPISTAHIIMLSSQFYQHYSVSICGGKTLILLVHLCKS